MTRLGGVKNQGGGAGAGVGGRGGGPGSVNLRDLGEEEQRVHELLEILKQIDPNGRSAVLGKAGVKDPVGAQGLKRIATMFDALGLALDGRGIARFKADRALPPGGSMSTPVVANAYVRALQGNEIVIKVDRSEEQSLRPSERALLDFLREMQKKRGADTLRPVKRMLGLGNPSVPPPIEKLRNEYVGVATVKAIAHATTMRELPLTPEGWRKLIEQLEAERQESGSEEE